MMNKLLMGGLTGLTLMVAGCATHHGEQQASEPPRLIYGSNNAVVWDRGDAFGPVPLRLAAVAAMHCTALDTSNVKWQSEGFHARAKDLQGREFPGGGYFCKPRTVAAR